MKNLTVSLNETENKLFKERAEKRNLTPYALHKKLIKEFLDANPSKDLIIIRDKKAVLATYFLVLYGLTVTTILTLLVF